MNQVPFTEIIRSLGCKMATAKNVMIYLKEDLRRKKIEDTEELYKCIAHLTKISLPLIKIYIGKSKTTSLTFQSILNKRSRQMCKLPYHELRNVIYTMYLIEQMMPTKKMIETHINTNMSKYQSYTRNQNETYTLEQLDIDLIANNFILKRLQRTKKALLVEDSAQMYKRTIYLNKVRNLRQQNRNFVYVKSHNDLLLAVSSTNVLAIYDSYELKIDRLNIIEQFMISPKSSTVILLDSNESKLKPIDEYSSNQEMRIWLSKHLIPFSDNDHTAQLYSLVQKFRKRFPVTCELQDLFENYGFVVLKVPPELPSLSFFQPLISSIMNYDSDEEIIDFLNGQAQGKKFLKIEESLIKMEVKVYEEDLEFQRIIDSIQVAFRDNDVILKTAKDFEACEEYVPGVPKCIILD